MLKKIFHAIVRAQSIAAANTVVKLLSDEQLQTMNTTRADFVSKTVHLVEMELNMNTSSYVPVNGNLVGAV